MILFLAVAYKPLFSNISEVLIAIKILKAEPQQG